MDDWVFVDSCVWSAFFTKPWSAEKLAVDELIDDDRGAIVGPIVSEVLLGFRRKAEADWVASRLRQMNLARIGWNDWRGAAELGRNLAAAGRKLPLVDLVIAVVAMRLDALVYTTDPHFDSIARLKRYRP